MRVILTRMPTLDAALIRLDAWWIGLSSRERWLVGTMATLLVLVVLVYGVVKPLQAARADALADIRTYETLTARIRAAGTLTANRAPRREGPAASVVSGSAGTFGLVVSPTAIPGGVRVAVADASYDSLLAWLSDLSATSNLRVRRVSIQRRPAPGRVTATLDFAG
jgi:general secretion pathway protein M